MIYNNLGGTLSSTFKIGKNGTTIKNSGAELNIVDNNDELRVLNYKDKVTYELDKLSGQNKYSIKNQQGKIGKIISNNESVFYTYNNTPIEVPTFKEIGGMNIKANIQPLMKLPCGIHDEIVIKNGMPVVKRNIMKISFTGNEADFAYGVRDELGEENQCQSFNIWITSVDIKLSVTSIDTGLLCNYFASENNATGWWSDTAGIGTSNGHKAIFIKIPKTLLPGYDFSLTNEQKTAIFKSWITDKYNSGNPVTLYIALSHPIYEPIPEWNQYKYVEQIDVTTTITKQDESQPINPNNIATIIGTECVTTGYYAKPLISLPDGTCDKIAQKDGVWGIRRKAAKITFDGTEIWGLGKTVNDSPQFYINIPDAKYVHQSAHANAICNIFSVYSSDALYAEVGHGFSIVQRTPDFPIPRLTFSPKDIAGMDVWKAKLAEWATAGQPLEVYYELAEPAFEQIPAWNKYKYIHPIKVTTTIEKPDPDNPISPDNVATIIGTLPVVKAYYFAPLYKIDNFSDKIAYKNGQWGIERNIIKFELDKLEWLYGSGAEGTLINTVSYYNLLPTPVHSMRENIISSHFSGIETWTNDIPGVEILSNSSMSMRILRQTLEDTTIAGLQKWMENQSNNNTPVVVYAIRSTPIFEPIPELSIYGKINPIDVTTVVAKPNPNAPISPDNVASVTGTLPDTITSYEGKVKTINSDNSIYILTDDYVVEAQNEANNFDVTILSLTPVPMVIDSKKLNGINGENYIPNKYSEQHGQKIYELDNYTNNTIARISFEGKTSLTKPNMFAVNSPTNIATIKGVKNPAVFYYSKNKTNINLTSGITANVPELNKLPNGISDEIAYINNQWGIIRRVLKFTLTGTDTDGRYEVREDFTNHRLFGIWMTGNTVDYPKASIDSGILCTHFRSTTDYENADKQGIAYSKYDYLLYMKVPKSILTNYDNNWTDEQKTLSFKSWVADQFNSETPIIVYLPKKTPTFEPISEWNIYADISPIEVETSIVVGQSTEISPTNKAIISGTPCSTIGHKVRPLMRLSDKVYDKIVIRNGLWGIERQIGKVNFDGTEEWKIESNPTGTPVFVRDLSDSARNGSPYLSNSMCNRFPQINGDDMYNNNFSGAVYSLYQNEQLSPFLQFTLPEITTLEAWRAKLAEQPLEIYYELAEPIFEPVSEWNTFGKINSIDATTIITKQNTSIPISPDNIAIIKGTPLITTGYIGQSKQIMGELFSGDFFDGINLTRKHTRHECTGNEPWAWVASLVGIYSTHVHGVVGSMAICSHSDFSVVIKIENSTRTGFNTTYTEDIAPNYPNYAKEQIIYGQPITMVYEILTPFITRHNLDIPITNPDYVIEIVDDNNIIDNCNIDILPDSTIYGDRTYNYKHTKVGNVHNLIGAANATEIKFKATAPYLNGDIWTINGAEIPATYSDGQPLLPTAAITGSNIRMTIDREATKHIEGMVMPGENLLKNSDFRNKINNTDHWNTRPSSAITPYNGYIVLSDTNQNNDPSMTQSINQLPLRKGETFTIAILCERLGESPYGMSGGIWTGQSWGRVNWGNADPGTYYPEIGHKQTFIATCILEHDLTPDAYFAVTCRGTTAKIYAIKIELGDRFTGWDKPTFDVLRLSTNKPTPQSSLIINGLFDSEHLVNQQGQNTYTPAWLDYTVDMWNAEADRDLTIEILSYGIKVTNTSTVYKQLRQAIDGGIKAGIYTTSAYIYECTGHVDLAVTKVQPPFTAWCYEAVKPGLNCFNPKVDTDSADAKVFFGLTGGSSVTVGAIKLEHGPRFTGWDSPKPAETLAECQRYMLAFNTLNRIRAILTLTDRIDFFIPIPVSMRTTPAISKNSMKIITVNTGSVIDGFTFSVFSLAENGIIVSATKVAHGLSDAVLQIATNSAESTILDANLTNLSSTNVVGKSTIPVKI